MKYRTRVRARRIPALWLAAALSAGANQWTAEWQETVHLNGRREVVTGRQWIEADGVTERTTFHRRDGSAVPEKVRMRRQKTWRRSQPAHRHLAQPAAVDRKARIATAAPILPALESIPCVRLPPRDEAMVQAIEAMDALERKEGLRFGLRRPLDAPVRFRGETSEWALRLEVPGAWLIRVRLAEVCLPAGAELFLGGDGTWVGPYTAADVSPEGELWTESVFSTSAVLVCRSPAGAAAFDVVEALDGYKDVRVLALAKEGACHVDVSCHADWAAAALSVAGLGSIDYAGALWCTGVLLHDDDGAAGTDYLLTAYHCVANPSEADSAEFYWFYQTASCDAAPPDVTRVPRTGGGADWLAGQSYRSGGDFAFLRLRQAPPAGAAYAGWSSSMPVVGAAVACIHHPDGAYKRISLGAIHSRDAYWLDVRFSQGVTEPGSSGGPLFDAGRRVVGQLYGGSSSCANPSGLDSFGRFDAAFPIIESYLVTLPPGGWETGAVELGGGWRRLAWFGDYTPVDEWIWHAEHGWLYPSGETADDLWLWGARLGWLWTRASFYPYLWAHTRQGWLWYVAGTGTGLQGQFYDLSLGTYAWY